ncbi:MAG: copper oxidase [Deltaproteobacteria bacterium]|nr:copper oxidase [Deltaproteobacteria bacterium]
MHHEHHGMRMDMEGAVMNENLDQLPRDCTKISGEREITVHAGRKYARQFNGTMFTYDEREWNVEPCSKVTVTLINEDQVRHQWMIHDLPRYVYPEGMFHIEVNGLGKKTGTFIVPSAKKTYLVHCDIAQHTEKGMKAQLKVNGGNGDLPSILGITGARQPDAYPVQWSVWALGTALVAGLASAVIVSKSTGWVRSSP